MKLRVITKKYTFNKNIFPLNRFNGLRSSQRSPASVGVKFIKIIFTMKNHFRSIEGNTHAVEN